MKINILTLLSVSFFFSSRRRHTRFKCDWSSDVWSSDVYKVDHHGSANGTDANWLTALSPQIAVISAGKIDAAHQVPGSFHAFQFGHPRESTVKVLEQFTSGTRPPKTVTTMDGVKKPHPGIVITKAIYCTCLDDSIVIDATTLIVIK